MARPKGIPFNEDTAGANYAEFSISRKPDRAIKTQRLLFILLYVAFAAAYIVMFTIVVPMVMLIAVLPLFVLILWFFTWKLTKLEYTYVVYQGQMHVYRHNGYNKAKELFCVKVSENDGIFPLSDEESAKKIDSCAMEIDVSVGKGSEDRYAAIFSIAGTKTVIYFTAAAKLLTALRYYGGEKVIVTYVSR